MTLATALRSRAEDLVTRAAAGAPITDEARARLVEGALTDPRVRMQLRLAEYAHDEGRHEAWATELWRALDAAEGRA